jgi:hypothetical protein
LEKNKKGEVMSNIFKDTVYDKEKYLKEQEDFSVLTSTSDIFKNVKKTPIIIEEIKENEKIIVDNPEVVDFVNDKLSKFLEIRGQNWQNAIDNLEEYINYQKKYLLSKENIHKDIVNSVTDKKNAISFDLKSNEFEEKYKWYLEQEENSELQKTNYSKVQNMDRHWDNGVSVLEKIEKENYIQNASISLYANENRDLKEYVFGLLNNKINDFESSVYDNQKGFYFEKDFDKADELYSEKKEVVENIETIEDVNLKMDRINKEYEDLTHKNTNILEILSNIEEINLSSLKRDIERDRTENVDTIEDISKSFSNTLITKEVEEKFDIADLGKINTFNFTENKNPEFDINSKLERTVNLKKLDKLGNEILENDISFNKEDIKPISKELKELIKDRENALDFNRPYVSFENFNDITNQNYNEKKTLCKFLNMVDITDIEITPSRLNIEDTGNEYLASVITPQYIASFETTKIGKDKVDNIILELSESMESKYDLDLVEKIYGNSESKYDLSVRDNIRKMGKDFYADFIFNKYIGFEEPVKLEKETVIYLEKSNLEKINDREKVLDLELLNKDIEKEIKYEKEKNIDDEVDFTDENRKDEIKIDISETRERVFSDLAQYPLVRNNLIMLEENYTKEKIYGQYLDYEDNLDNSILLTIDYLVREELKIGKSEEIEDRKALDILENANARDLDDCLYMFDKFKEEKAKERERELEKDYEDSNETKVSRASGREKSERTIKDVDKDDRDNDFEDTYKKFFDDEVEI